MADVIYHEATCAYPGNPVPAVDGLSLEIADGEFMVLVGPSGSGKSTALRMLAGLEDVSAGQIRIGGRDVSRLPAKDRDIAMVFQNYALYPHMNVAENMAFALKLKRVPATARQAKVDESAALLDLEPYLARKPRALSGGQRQRVAMGRAIVREPSVFLMDEPLSNLDAKLRVETRAHIAALQSRLGTTTVYVTHDQVEAMTMGHRVAVLKDGILQQCDTPRALYDTPVNSFVAGFIGSPAMNLREAPLAPEGVVLGTALVPLERSLIARAHERRLETVVVGIRPESLIVTQEPSEKTLTVTVSLVEELGADSFLYGALDGDDPHVKPFVIRHHGPDAPRREEAVSVTVKEGGVHLFDPGTGLRIG